MRLGIIIGCLLACLAFAALGCSGGAGSKSDAEINKQQDALKAAVEKGPNSGTGSAFGGPTGNGMGTPTPSAGYPGSGDAPDMQPKSGAPTASPDDMQKKYKKKG
jgi:hypothetical protein